MTEKQLISLPEAAKIVGISADLFRYYVKTGRAPKPALEVSPYKFYNSVDIEGWKPERMTLGRPKSKG